MSDTLTEKVSTLREVEDAHIRYVFELTGGNVARTARLLGLDRRTMYRRARQAGIEPTIRARSESAVTKMRNELESTRAELARIKAELGAM